jgi:hypothetical protein
MRTLRHDHPRPYVLDYEIDSIKKQLKEDEQLRHWHVRLESESQEDDQGTARRSSLDRSSSGRVTSTYTTFVISPYRIRIRG